MSQAHAGTYVNVRHKITFIPCDIFPMHYPSVSEKTDSYDHTGFIQVIYKVIYRFYRFSGYIQVLQVLYRFYTGFIQVLYRFYTGFMQS